MYIGNNLQVANPSYKIIDDISSGFNGSATSFALQVNGETPVPFPINTQQVMLSVNGVVQEPDPSGSAGFKLLGSNIVFSSAPANGHAFFGTILAGADYVTAGSEFPDGSATAPSFTFQADQDTGWFRSGAGDVGYSSNGVAILNFNGNGLTIASGKGLTVDTDTLFVSASLDSVGIGTTPPSGGQANSLYFANGNANIWGSGNVNLYTVVNARYSGTGWAYNNNGTASYIAQQSGEWSFHNASSGSADATATFAQRMKIDSSGRLLLGTTTEGEVSADNLTIADSGNCGITIRSGSSNAGSIYFSDATTGADEYRGYIAYNQPNDFLQIGTGTVERLRIDASGNLLAGSTTSRTINSHVPRLQVTGTTYSHSTVSIINNEANANGAYLFLAKQRSGAVGGSTAVQNGDTIGQIRFNVGDGTDMESYCAQIEAFIDGTPSGNDVPGGLAFLTTADGASSATERMRIDSSGVVRIGGNDAYNASDKMTLVGSGNTSLTIDATSSTEASVFFADGATGSEAYRGYVQYKNANDSLVLGTAATLALTLDSSQNATFAGTVSDSVGELRSVPIESASSAQTPNASSAGHAIHISSGGVTINNSVFSTGDVVTIVNNSGSDQTITQGSGLTLYNTADASTGNRTLAGRGMATMWFASASVGYISGAGLS